MSDTLHRKEWIGRLGFRLLCGYRMDGLSEGWATLRQIYQTHSHIEPADDGVRFHQAVWRALGDVLGPNAAKELWQLIVGTLDAASLPASSVMYWLREKMPMTAEGLVPRIQHYYSSDTSAGLQSH